MVRTPDCDNYPVLKTTEKYQNLTKTKLTKTNPNLNPNPSPKTNPNSALNMKQYVHVLHHVLVHL